jgi:SAM-dependent methyltransferase
VLYETPDLYDTLLPVSAHQLTFYKTLAERQHGAVLALACGSGQLIVPIASLGRPATGLDVSPAMLTAARRRAVAAGATVEFVEADMRGFDLGRRFSLIFLARNSLLHLSEPGDFAALFAAVRRHLAPGGIFAFDIFNPELRLLARPAGQRFPVMRVESGSYGELLVEATVDYDRGSQVNRATWFISTTTHRDRWVAPLHLRSIFPQELLILLENNGFRLLSRDGDYAGGRFSSASGTQVCQCEPVQSTNSVARPGP